MGPRVNSLLDCHPKIEIHYKTWTVRFIGEVGAPMISKIFQGNLEYKMNKRHSLVEVMKLNVKAEADRHSIQEATHFP